MRTILQTLKCVGEIQCSSDFYKIIEKILKNLSEYNPFYIGSPFCGIKCCTSAKQLYTSDTEKVKNLRVEFTCVLFLLLYELY